MQFEVPTKGNVSGYLCNHGSPTEERGTASSRDCAMLWTQASDDEASSDIIGGRQLTSCVFVCMLQTRVTLTAFPIVTPRGRSVSFPTQGTMVT